MKPGFPSPSLSRSLVVALSVVVSGWLPVASVLAEPAPMRASEPSAKPTPLPAPGAKTAGAQVAQPAEKMESGKVLETMNAANYTYARVQTTTGEKWIAGPQTAVKVGDAITWPGGEEMKNFPSKTLGRTFDSIAFVAHIVVGVTPGAATAGASSPHVALSGKAAEGPEVKDVAKAEGGMTIAEIYDGRAKLEGKEVTVRGKVVKFNAAIMGRNWLHLHDGSRGAAGDRSSTGHHRRV